MPPNQAGEAGLSKETLINSSFRAKRTSTGMQAVGQCRSNCRAQTRTKAHSALNARRAARRASVAGHPDVCFQSVSGFRHAPE